MCHSNNARTSGFQQPHGFGRFAGRFGEWPGHFSAPTANVPVNVRERGDWYEIFVYAPGLSRDAFQVNVTDEVLNIRFQPAAESREAAENWLHREYARGPFERQFLLHGKVDTSAIAARYADGVLELTLQIGRASCRERVSPRV